jgi:hypothetical protein
MISEEQFLETWNRLKSAKLVAEELGVTERAAHSRRRRLEEKHGTALKVEDQRWVYRQHIFPNAVDLGIENGTVIVFSDAHFWPSIRSTAFKALLYAIETYAPKAVICNGDAFDGAAISRHPPMGWEKLPSVIQELNACKAMLGEVSETAKTIRHNVKLIWTMGNHDARFAARLAANAPQYVQTPGFRLEDHFEAWQFAWSVWLTKEVIVKHRYKGGVHATHNNTVGAGTSIVTGHLHSLKVTPYADYNGNRFGVDTGTLADPYGPQFSYSEHNPLNHRSGFAMLTLKDGQLLWPELFHVWNKDHVEFRGEIIQVDGY